MSKEVILKKKKKYTAGDILFNILNYAFFAIFTAICIYPFYYLIINTISNNQMSANSLINFWPKDIHISNYVEILKLKGFGQAAIISLFRTVIGTACTVMASAFLGFMFTQRKMWGRKVWYRFIIITMYFNAGMIPIFITMLNLHLLNNFWVYVIPAIVQPFNIILVKTYVESISPALQEAAEIDGASILTVFFKVIFPISKPILATIAIFSAVNQWNSYTDTLLYMTDQKLFSLQYLLWTYINQATSLATLVKNNAGSVGQSAISLATQQTPTSIKMTVSVVVVLPILFVYPIFQKYFVSGIMIGSVKG